MTVSWFWLKRAEGKRELRFVVFTYPYSGVYLLAHWIDRWAWFPVLAWKAICQLARKKLVPSVHCFELLKHIQNSVDIAAQDDGRWKWKPTRYKLELIE